MGNLSEHFTMEEMTRSATASSRHIDNTPSKEACINLAHLCQDILEPVRREYGHPITVTSGYRCPALNKAVGGAASSQHMAGGAADIKCSATSRAALFNIIKRLMDSGVIKVGQLIWEYGSRTEPNWIHVSIPRTGKPNNQILYLYSK